MKKPAPPLTASTWLNINAPLSLEQLRGRVVMIEAFQIMCTGCVEHAMPQAQRVREYFKDEDLVVIGLHCVFENHATQTSLRELESFIREHRLTFPVAVDQLDAAGQPVTLRAYGMQGTPTLVLIDRESNIRMQRFGPVSDLEVGAAIATLLK